MTTFTLTTPPMGGTKHPAQAQHIEAFQRLLTKRGYYGGQIDGVYGRGTASAVYNAKYDLGYLHPDHNAGDLLYSYLSGEKPLTLSMRALAAERKHHRAAQESLRQKALDWYIKYNGTKEDPPNSNECFVTKWYGMVGPWCAMTGIMAYAQSGSKVFTLDNAHRYDWAYVPNIVNDARRGLYGLTVTHDPQPGDGIAFDWPGESPGIADHFGVFEKWIDKAAGTFFSREGNTSGSNNSDGGEIMQQSRNLSLVQNFIVIGG